MKHLKKMIGKKVYLSPMLLDSIEQYTQWLNDFEVAMYLDIFSRMLTYDNEKEFIADCNKNDRLHLFGIVDLNTDELIGNCGLINIEYIDRIAELGIFIGHKEFWSKGHGSDAVCLLLDYGFNILNLNNIMLRVYEYNKRAVGCYEKCGFKIIGKRRKSKLIAGRAYDLILMDIVAEEFNSPYIKKFFKDT